MDFIVEPAKLEHVPDLALNLRKDDLLEIIDGTELNPVLSMSLGIVLDNTIVFTSPNGEIAGIAGVSDDGCLWMHCTEAPMRYPIQFVKQAKKWVESLPHPILYNWADIRNTAHLKFLKLLNFKFLNVVPYGPNNLYFVEFVKLWY